jgi:protein NEDD1
VGGVSFELSDVERLLDDKLGAFGAGIHSEVSNLHLELLRQFQIQLLEVRLTTEE